jgi:hypothetical protein
MTQKKAARTVREKSSGQLTQKYRNGQIGTLEFDELLKTTIESAPAPALVRRLDDPEAIALYSLLSEILDQQCRTKEATEFVLNESRTWLGSPLPSDDRVCREMIRMSAQYAIVEFYRMGDYESADRLLQECLEARSEITSKDGDDFELVGFIYYNAGRVQRRKFDYASAEKSFSQALRQFEAASSCEGKDREVYCSYRIALILALGMAQINSARSFLREALCNTIAAQAILRRLHDPINLAYANLIRAEIERSRSTGLSAEYEHARTFAQKALDEFTAHGKQYFFYSQRAHFEIAKNLYNSALYAEAIQELPKGPFSFSKQEDKKWKSDAEILRSRIYHKQARQSGEKELLHKAVSAADNALEFARSLPKDDRSVAEALIAKAEAQIDLTETPNARKNLTLAYELAERPDIKNPVRRAVCIVYLALSYATDQDAVKANEYWNEWLQLRKTVENNWVHKRAKEVRAILDRLDEPFVVYGGNDKVLTHTEHDRALRKFLLLRVARRGGTAKERAEALGVSRETYYKWLKELNINLHE